MAAKEIVREAMSTRFDLIQDLNRKNLFSRAGSSASKSSASRAIKENAEALEDPHRFARSSSDRRPSLYSVYSLRWRFSSGDEFICMAPYSDSRTRNHESQHPRIIFPELAIGALMNRRANKGTRRTKAIRGQQGDFGYRPARESDSDVPVVVAVDRLHVFELGDVGFGVAGGGGDAVKNGSGAQAEGEGDGVVEAFFF